MTTRRLILPILLAPVFGLAACGIERRQERRENRREDRKDLVSQPSQTSQAQSTVVAGTVGPTLR
jgi:hypothetical protein